MKLTFPSPALLRALVVTGTVLAVMGGITFAVLVSNKAVISSSRITSATAAMQVSLNGIDFGPSMPGFAFHDIEPGGSPGPAEGQDVYVKNSGSLSLMAGLSVDPTTLVYPNDVDFNQVFVVVSPASGGQTLQLSLADLMEKHNTVDAQPLNHKLVPGQITHYKVRIFIAANALASTASRAEISGLDLVFTGSSVSGA